MYFAQLQDRNNEQNHCGFSSKFPYCVQYETAGESQKENVVLCRPPVAAKVKLPDKTSMTQQ